MTHIVRTLVWIRVLFAAVWVGAGLGVTGCTMFSDPAVRIARCIHEAAARVERAGGAVTAECRPRSREPFLVVIHPARDLTDAELLAGGLPLDQVGAVQRLHWAAGADGLYVLPEGPGRSSFTSIGWRQAVVPELLVVSKPAGATVQIQVRDGAYGVAVERLW